MNEPFRKMTGLTFAQYRAVSGANWSALKHYDKSPAHYRAYIDAPPKQSDDMLTGSALHALVLEGIDAFTARYAVAPESVNRRTKEGKETWTAFKNENNDKDILTQEQADTIRLMASAIRAHPFADRLLARCREREVSIRWEDPATGIPCKARLDGFDPDQGLVLDLKTTRDASPKGFGRAAADLAYHGQAAFYLNGLEAGGIEARFVFCVVEKTPPYAVALYHIDDEALAAGRQLAARCLELHAWCLDHDKWPGYPEVRALELPRWAL